MNILFMCVANSARSQMAEGLAKSIFGSTHHIKSAGSMPTKVNPFAVKALADLGINIDAHYSKAFNQLPAEFANRVDLIITLCAEEVCPPLPISTKHLHWPLPDPAAGEGSDEERLAAFKKVRDTLREKLENLGL